MSECVFCHKEKLVTDLVYEEIREQIHFQEQYFDSEIIM